MPCLYSNLREKEVINLADGRRLGYVCDLTLDLDCGRVTAILVPGETTFLTLGRTPAVTIPWESIATIGEDTILVRADCPCDPGKKPRK